MAVAEMNFTASQLEILKLLADGKPHGRKEILHAMGDQDQTLNNLRVHIHYLRKSLPPGEDIVCRDSRYTHVKLVPINEIKSPSKK